MRKIYMKPVVILESFAMSTHIAANCERIVGNPAKGTCSVNGTGGVAIFTDSLTTVCDYTPGSYGQPEDTWDGFCYHVPEDNNDLFNS